MANPLGTILNAGPPMIAVLNDDLLCLWIAEGSKHPRCFRRPRNGLLSFAFAS